MHGQADVDALRLERAELQQKLSAAKSDAEAARQELTRALGEGGAAKAAMASVHADLAKIRQQRDNAWKVQQCLPLQLRFTCLHFAGTVHSHAYLCCQRCGMSEVDRASLSDEDLVQILTSCNCAGDGDAAG